MKPIRLVLGAFLFAALSTSVSLAQTGAAGRTFVSGQGSDSNPCSVTAPCRTFTGALAQTAPGGEVVVLTSAGYGPFVITHSVTASAPEGVYAGITETDASAAAINILAGASDVVTPRGLTVIGPGGPPSLGEGIDFGTGGILHVEGCEVRAFGAGIDVVNFNSQTFIKDTVVKDNSVTGIALLSGFAGTMSVSMDHVTVTNNNNGIALEGAGSGAVVIQAAIRNSTISGNETGVFVNSSAGASATLNIESCLIANGGIGIETSLITGAVASASISNCLISNNSTSGFNVSGGAILSRGNNTVVGNGANVGTLTPLTAQ